MQARTFSARDNHGQDFFLAHEFLSDAVEYLLKNGIIIF
jgi:hypothetical protein